MQEWTWKGKLMGTAFTLCVVAEKETQAQSWLEIGVKEIQRIESLLSEFIPTSITSHINQLGKKRLSLSPEVYQLISRSIAISRLTGGDFDITVSPLKALYHFKNKQFSMPKKADIQSTLQRVGYRNIVLHSNTSSIEFLKQDMKISFAAIGKGYASDCVKRLWQSQGVVSGFINASGDLNAFGEKANGTAWNIGIAHPKQANSILLHVPLHQASVATSGDAEQYFLWKGKRYSHTIHPKTGFPLQGIRSVSVFSPSAELSDALATAVYVKGVQKGLDFIHQLPQTHCIIINDQYEVFFSQYLEYKEHRN